MMVGEGVCVFVGVKVIVCVEVAVCVAVEGSRVTEAVGDVEGVSVGVTVGVSDGLFLGMKIKARRRMSPIMAAGIPNLTAAGGMERAAQT
jgi:hypothetical protein